MSRSDLIRWSHMLGFLFMSVPALAAELPLFSANEIIDIELRGPLHETIRDTRDRSERPFELVLGDASFDVRVRVRGNSRAKACHFPPLRLMFSRNGTEGTLFEGLGPLKLVTHCKSGQSYDQNVIDEYLAYRLFGLLSDKAFRVRLLRVMYVDTGHPGREPLSRFALAIEPEKGLARRLGGEVLRTEHVKTAYLDKDQAALLFVFQFLIGNTDWSLVRATDKNHCCHNVTLLGVGNMHVPVPYDFDQAGVVDAAYAKPHPGLRLRTVRTRRYRGNCVSGLDLESAVRRVAAAEANIHAQLASLPDATSNKGQKRQAYLDEFFEEAREPQALAAEFERSCIG